MTNPNNLRGHQADGQDQQMIPLRIPGCSLYKGTRNGSESAGPAPAGVFPIQGIASDLGLEYLRTLTIDDLNRMAGNDLDRDVLRSFRNADLVIEAADGTDTRFIAMEISYTADQRDCSRAIRNAELITRFTGKPAWAAVASVRNNQAAAAAVEAGAMHWHPLEDRTPDPE